MTQYPPPLDQRHAAAMMDFAQRITKLETRTAGIDSGFPLMALPGVVSPSYTTGDPAVQVNGAVDGTGAAVYSGPYQHLASYTPVASDSVIVLPVPALQTYIVLGRAA